MVTTVPVEEQRGGRLRRHAGIVARAALVAGALLLASPPPVEGAWSRTYPDLWPRMSAVGMGVDGSGEVVLCGNPVACVRVDRSGAPTVARGVVPADRWASDFYTLGGAGTCDGGVLLVGLAMVHGDTAGIVLRLDSRLEPVWSQIGDIWWGFSDELWLRRVFERRRGTAFAIGGMRAFSPSGENGWLVEFAPDGAPVFEASLGGIWSSEEV